MGFEQVKSAHQDILAYDAVSEAGDTGWFSTAADD